MEFTEYNLTRVREVNKKNIIEENDYILYWMQAYRRLNYNHALEYANHLSHKYKKELVIFEGIRSNYPWNSERIHQFILEGIKDNYEKAKELGINYFSYVETDKEISKNILIDFSKKACAVITDDFPCFIIPNHIEKFAKQIGVKLFAVDSNSIIPISKYGEVSATARGLRTRIHKNFEEAYLNKSKKVISFFQTKKKSKFNYESFIPTEKNISEVMQKLKFTNQVPKVEIHGGYNEAKNKLNLFLEKNLNRYKDFRSNPHSPEITPGSALSPYLHFGHISTDEIITEIFNFNSKNEWTIKNLNTDSKGDRENFFHTNQNINSYLDELLTWRDVGYLFFWNKKEFNKDLNSLPNWVKENLKKHTPDKREYLYSKKEFEEAKTHDSIWNSAQKELVITGKMHNYMRMLWGKKIIEWSKTYQEAFETMEELNNKYALDGRNPNSYTGILWCFGLFDRPWFPERPVHGVLRYMSSDSTKRKFKLGEYLDYIKKLENKSESLF